MLDTDDDSNLVDLTVAEYEANLARVSDEAARFAKAVAQAECRAALRVAAMLDGPASVVLKALGWDAAPVLKAAAPPDPPAPVADEPLVDEDDPDDTDLYDDTPDEVAAAAVEHAIRCVADGTDPQPGLDALHALVHAGGDETFEKADFRHDLHPRDDQGRFVSKDAIKAAAKDPAQAEKLRKKVTDPEQRQKLDDAISGDTDASVLGSRREIAPKNRAVRAEQVKQVTADREQARAIRDRLRTQHQNGEPLDPNDLRALIPHLSTMTHAELSNVRTMLGGAGAKFGGTRLREDRVKALTDWARDQAQQANPYVSIADLPRYRNAAARENPAKTLPTDAEDAGVMREGNDRSTEATVPPPARAAAGPDAPGRGNPPGADPAGVAPVKPAWVPPAAAKRGVAPEQAFQGDMASAMGKQQGTIARHRNEYKDQLAAVAPDARPVSAAEKLGTPGFSPNDPAHVNALHKLADAIETFTPGRNPSSDPFQLAKQHFETVVGDPKFALHTSTRKDLLALASRVRGAVADVQNKTHLAPASPAPRSGAADANPTADEFAAASAPAPAPEPERPAPRPATSRVADLVAHRERANDPTLTLKQYGDKVRDLIAGMSPAELKEARAAAGYKAPVKPDEARKQLHNWAVSTRAALERNSNDGAFDAEWSVPSAAAGVRAGETDRDAAAAHLTERLAESGSVRALADLAATHNVPGADEVARMASTGKPHPGSKAGQELSRRVAEATARAALDAALSPAPASEPAPRTLTTATGVNERAAAKVRKPAPDERAKLLGEYTDLRTKTFKDVNAHLRGGALPAARRKKAERIDAALKSAFEAEGKPAGTVLHRGEAYNEAEGAAALAALQRSLETGEPVTRNGYTSTSTDPAAAASFADDYEGKGKQYPIKYEISGGRGLDMSPYSRTRKQDNFDEDEFLLPHNSRLRVLSVTPPGEPDRFGNRKPAVVKLEHLTDDSSPAPAPATPAPAASAPREFRHTTPDDRKRHAAFLAAGAGNMADTLVRQIAKKTGQPEDAVRAELAPAAK